MTLYRRRVQYGMGDTFSNISDEELDCQIREILTQTPYSGETYVRRGMKGKGMHVQRSRVRESLKRIDGVARAVRRRYAICRRVYKVTH